MEMYCNESDTGRDTGTVDDGTERGIVPQGAQRRGDHLLSGAAAFTG